MKRLIKSLVAVVVVIGLGIGAWVLIDHDEAALTTPTVERFALSEEMYEQGEFREITAEELQQLVAEQKSFVVVLHMAICPAEFPLTSIAKQLAHADDLRIYGLTEEEFKQTDLAQEIKYLPSAAIYHEGELAAYLDAEVDADLPYYQTVEGLRSWLGLYLTKI